MLLVYYSPEDHLTHIEAIISYHQSSQQFVSTGVDCEGEINYQLGEEDKEFLRSKIQDRVRKKYVPVTFLRESSDSEVMFCHIVIEDYHFFLVFKSDNYTQVQLQLQDIEAYLRNATKVNKIDQKRILMEFKVNKSEFSEMCESCRTQGICAPKYLNQLFQEVKNQ